jgi:hypothetical protein
MGEFTGITPCFFVDADFKESIMKLDMAKIDFLKKRAEEFLDTAEYHFKKRKS